jgi:hypothetical protein
MAKIHKNEHEIDYSKETLELWERRCRISR